MDREDLLHLLNVFAYIGVFGVVAVGLRIAYGIYKNVFGRRRDARRARKDSLKKLEKCRKQALRSIRALLDFDSMVDTMHSVHDLDALIKHVQGSPPLFRSGFIRWAHLNDASDRRSPLVEWLDLWICRKHWRYFAPYGPWDHKGSAIQLRESLNTALKAQRKEWAELRIKLYAEAREYHELYHWLSLELGIEPTDFLAQLPPGDFEKLRVEITETPRDKLARVRAEIAKLREQEQALEQELLDEQPADLPHRKAAGISSDN